MTAQEFSDFLAAAREHKVQEFSLGDTHVLFSPVALVPITTQTEPEMKIEAPPVAEDEAAVAKLMDDPDLFLQSDGPSPVPT